MRARGQIEFEVGQVFKSVNRFREVLVDYAIQEGFALARIKNDL